MTHRFVVSIVALLSCALQSSSAQHRIGTPAGGALDKIDPIVRAQLDTAQKLNVLLLGTTQLFAPIGGLDAFAKTNRDADRRTLRPRTIATLRAIADGEQPAILRGLGNPPATRFWLVNAISVTLTPAQIKQATALEQVRYIYPLGVAPPPTPDTAKLREILRPPATRSAFDPSGKTVAWYLEKLGVTRAWNESHATGAGVVIASIDNGINYLHSDLRDNVWTNAREIPDNKIDDDKNGYVDDYYGFDFAQMQAEVGTFAPQPGAMHGTITSGILVGDGSGGTITGVAPRARIMMLRGVAHAAALSAYQYAIDQGADVLSMSFSLPNLGNLRGVWRMMSEHAVAVGLVLGGGAGNFQQNRQIPEQHLVPKDVPTVISVGGVDSLSALSPISSLGPAEWSSVALYNDYPMPKGIMKPDVVAFPGPGYDILVHPNGYLAAANNKTVQGNSFAGPQGMGVAAIMLGVAPSVPAWRIKEIIEQTARDLGESGRDNKFGAGLIDAAAAVREAIADHKRRTARR